MNFEPEEVIDINDYEVDQDDKEYGIQINMLNIYICYFKQLHDRREKDTMFEHVDYGKEDSTNKCMELFYGEILKYKVSEEEDKGTLYGPDSELQIDKCNELYSLYINYEPKYVCKYLIPIISHIATLDWTTISWSIIPVKTA
jgi:hypothetical protein